MTPGARLAAAAEILDDILIGQRAETALSRWARASRYAGSKDRAAIRDLVFDALRKRSSYAALGGALTGRGLMIGALRAQREAPETLMTGEGYMMPPPSAEEVGRSAQQMTLSERCDMPNWLVDLIPTDHGAAAQDIMKALRDRAPVFLRVAQSRGTMREAIESLADDGVSCVAHDHVKTALRVVENERKIRQSKAYTNGLVELQDASSQAAVLELPILAGHRVLDYCAGGGGKSLAMADVPGVTVMAHDANVGRMADLQARSDRAGVSIAQLSTEALAHQPLFDLVLVDAPCSGSGTWRRDPETKWQLTAVDLAERVELQFKILCDAAQFVSVSGTLAYATCSVLNVENDSHIERFLQTYPEWSCVAKARWLPNADGDGFFLAQFSRA